MLDEFLQEFGLASKPNRRDTLELVEFGGQETVLLRGQCFKSSKVASLISASETITFLACFIKRVRRLIIFLSLWSSKSFSVKSVKLETWSL